MNRRQAIKTIGALAGAASTAKLLAACGENGGGTIDTFVFVMMENRSYDHYLGARSLLEGKPGDGLMAGMSNPDRLGNQVEIWPATADAMCIPDPPHSWNASHAQWNAGANDQFVITHQNSHGSDVLVEPMQYLVRDQVPVHWALADSYTSCDRWFSSLMCGTLPNRMYWHAATSNGAKVNDEVLGGAFEGVTSLHHNLETAGIDWAYYYVDAPVLGVLDDLPLESRLRRFYWDFIDQAEAGTLPPVVYIDPGFASNDDHPPHHPMLGQQFLSSIYTALSRGPHWKRCMLVITYDEHGGFYDHVSPPTAPDDRAADGFDQLGFRVPTVVAGPYVKQGHVSSVQYDHTSPLKHLENVFGLPALSARSTAASDLMDCIDLERLAAGDAAEPIEMPAIEIDESQLPDNCRGSSLRTYDHDILQWAEANSSRLGEYYRLHESRDTVYGIADYLDRYGLGRIRRGR